MTATYEKQKSEAQILAVEQYLTDNVLGDNFVCQHYNACKSSHPATFYEGQLHHVGKYYGVSIKNPAASSGVLKKPLSDFTPQEAGNMTHRDSMDFRFVLLARNMSSLQLVLIAKKTVYQREKTRFFVRKGEC